MKYDFQTRRRWFDAYLERVQQGDIPVPPVGHRYTCPCCGYPTLSERSSWDICSLCNWEDDGQDDPEADQVWGGPNYEYSLSDARQNFERYLIMYNPARPATRISGNSNTPKEAYAKATMIETFEKMIGDSDDSNLDRYWQEILMLEKILEAETYRLVREHEARMSRKRRK